jgi:2,4-dienoyl-CoA reductase-like NADH-dependent reductase (Old Yellow Enzyme family)/NADPH-dependent 2,4-dienoyl-CoA reductase/sulfur reductase-like enzyme
MDKLFRPFSLGSLELPNRFVFPPIKLGYGKPDGRVTDRQLQFYRRIAEDGPAVVILEPAAVTPDGREHPKQPCVHLENSALELRKIVEVIHAHNRLACLHLNHAGAAANPKASGGKPRAPSPITCPTTGQESEPLEEAEIKKVVAGYAAAAQKAVEAGFDLIEIQAGHGYLVSQFLNEKINRRRDRYGEDRLLFAREVLAAIKQGAPGLPFIVRVSADEMSPDYGIAIGDLEPFMSLAEEQGAAAVHAGMGNSCFSPPWYFHHGSLPEKPQIEGLTWLRKHTSLPLIAAGRMGRKKKLEEILEKDLADLIALGRPLIADPGLIGKWREGREEQVVYCGYCLQGCLHRLKSGEPLGCNLNPETGLPPLGKTSAPLKVLVVGGGPAGMSAALHLTRRGHRVTLVEKKNRLGGQFSLAWRVPGKEAMRDGLDGLRCSVENCGATILLNTTAQKKVVKEVMPDLVVWAVGASPWTPQIPGLEGQHAFAAVELLEGEREVRGPRVLVIGAGRVGLEVVEKLGRQEYEVVATKRTDPLGGMMEMITRKLAIKRVSQLPNVTLMPHTTVKAFAEGSVELEQDGVRMSVEPFQTVLLATGMKQAPGPDDEVRNSAGEIETIGDARDVLDIYTAVHAGYRLAQNR